jgi:hypothetical protein
MTPITVIKRNVSGEEIFCYTGIILRSKPVWVVLEARFNRAICRSWVRFLNKVIALWRHITPIVGITSSKYTTGKMTGSRAGTVTWAALPFWKRMTASRMLIWHLTCGWHRTGYRRWWTRMNSLRFHWMLKHAGRLGRRRRNCKDCLEITRTPISPEETGVLILWQGSQYG